MKKMKNKNHIPAKRKNELKIKNIVQATFNVKREFKNI